MPQELDGLKVAILATDGVEQVELTEPRHALERVGAEVELISLQPGKIQGFNHFDKGDTFRVDRALDAARADDYDALLLPGGVANPDRLRTEPAAVRLVRQFFAARKPVAAICHGPWLLVEADVVRHRTLTSWPSLRTDITNAGGCWVDEAVHVDKGLVTSRKPDDLPAFCAKMIEEFREGIHQPAGDRTASGGRVETPAAVHAESSDTTENKDAAVDISSEDSFPASDPPSSLQVT